MATASKTTAPPTMAALIDTIEEKDLAAVLTALLSSATKISTLLRTRDANPTANASKNAFGDEQLELDVEADALIRDALAPTKAVRVLSSEEAPTEAVQTEGAALSVAYDPLDGSSIIGCNFAVGTIAGVWRAPTFVGETADTMTAALAVVYGPRTTAFVAARAWGRGVREAVLQADGSWRVARTVAGLADGKLFAPANLRCTGDHAGYRRLVEWYISQRYTLRYTGGMVPDVTQIFVKGFGVFASPVSPGAPAKLRLVYEAVPMAFLMVMAGGCSSDGETSLLKVRVEACDQRTAVCLGTAGEVERFEQHCGKQAASSEAEDEE